jgi:hypothetical protein
VGVHNDLVTQTPRQAGDGLPPDAAAGDPTRADPAPADPTPADLTPADLGEATGDAMHVIDERMRTRLNRLERLLGARGDDGHLPAWLRPTQGESRVPVGLAILAAVALQLALPSGMMFRPEWLLPAIELALFAVLMVANPVRINRESTVLRAISLTLVIVASWALTWSAARLIYDLVDGQAGNDPRALLLTGGSIWLTNIIVFALWYWETDRGGPAARANARRRHPDFLFSQMTVPEIIHEDWEPYFVDYLYLSFTNATAFSPTDTLPLSRWAKLAMMFQSVLALATLVLVVARAVNILR